MPQVAAVKEKKKSGAVMAFVIGLVLLLLVIGGITYLWWLYVPSVASVVAKAKTDDANSNYAQAESLLKQALPRALNKSDRENVLIGLATTEFDLGKYSDSVTYYQQANNLEPGLDSTLYSLAQAAQDAQDNSAELSADKQLLPIVESTDIGPTRQSDINDLKNEIAELEK